MKKQTAQRVIDTDRGGANGGQVYATVAALGPAVAVSPPPTGLQVTANTLLLSAQAPMALISLLWYPPQAQTVRQYQIQVATDSGFTTNVAYYNASDTTASVDVITSAAGITYYFRVRVFAGNLISDWSSSISVLASADTTPAGLPTSLAYTWDGADLLITWTNPSSTNLRDVEIRIWESSSKTVLYHTGFSAISRYAWQLPQQRIDTGGSLDPAVYVELRSRTWSQVFGTSTAGISPTNSAPSAPASVALISSIGTLTISVSATAPTDFAAYRYRIIQTLPSASDVVFDSPSPLENYSLYSQATYQVGVKVLDVYGQLSSETLSSASIIDTLTIGSLRAEIIYSDSDGNSDATLHVPLSNAVLASGGITYATSSTWNKYVRGERTLLDRYRIIALSIAPASGTTSWYLRVSSDASTWTYYAGPVTSSRILTIVASAAAAQAAAISTATLGGTTTSKIELPATIEARFVEVWMRNAGPANSTIYEFYPRRLIEADDIYAQSLSAISANLGSITAGTITGATIQTAPSGARVLLDSGGITTYDSSNNVQITATTATDGTLTAGAGVIEIDKDGIRIDTYLSSILGYSAQNALLWRTGAQDDGFIEVGRSSTFFTQQMDIKSAGAALGGSYSNLLQLTAESTSGGTDAILRLTGQNSTLSAAVAITGDTAVTGTLRSTGSAAIGGAIQSTARLYVKGQGTSSATYALIGQNSAGSNIIYCRDDGLSNFISSAWSSDERHKRDLRPIDESDLARFRALEPLQYIRTNGPGGPEYGVSAQRTRPIFPEMVIEDPDGFLSVRYNDFIPLLMAEVRILRARVETLEARAA